jgi:hypothetical protein
VDPKDFFATEKQKAPFHPANLKYIVFYAQKPGEQ